MGYDCTLHIVDEGVIRDRFVPRLLGRSQTHSSFDDRPDAEELWGKTRAALAGELDEDGRLLTPEIAANFVCQLAIAYCAAEFPYHYERGFCLSLWPELPDGLDAEVPEKFLGDTAMLFDEIVAVYPDLMKRFPEQIMGNFSSGIFVPAEKVSSLLQWVEERVKRYPKAERRMFRGLLLVLQQATSRRLGYWEGSDLPVPFATIRPAKSRIVGLQEIQFPNDGLYDWVGHDNDLVVFSRGHNPDPADIETVFVDLSSWPPKFISSQEYSLRAAKSAGGQWVLASMTGEHTYPPLYRARLCQKLGTPPKVLLPDDERENGISWVDFSGETVVAVLSAQDLPPSYNRERPWVALIEEEGRLVPMKGLAPNSERFTTYGVAHLRDGEDIFIWEGDGYRIAAGRFERIFALGAVNTYGCWTSVPWGDDGFWYLSNNCLFAVKRGCEPKRHLPKLDNIEYIAPGPQSSLLLVEGKRKPGDLGKLYFFSEDAYLRIKPEVFEDEDPDDIMSLHWSEGCQKLVAATFKRLCNPYRIHVQFAQISCFQRKENQGIASLFM